MGDGSSSGKSLVQSLKNEWSLFWEAFQGDSEVKSQNAFETGKLEILSLDEIRDITRALLQDRKKINQKMESLYKEIDLNSAKLESLRLVGGEEEPVLNRINELSDLGQSMANALSKLDQKLKEIRDKETQLQEDLITT